MKGRFKLPMWVFPLLIAALVAVFGWWANVQIRVTIEDKLAKDLTTTLNDRANSLEIWTATQKRFASLLAGQPELRALATNVLEEFSRSRGVSVVVEV